MKGLTITADCKHGQYKVGDIVNKDGTRYFVTQIEWWWRRSYDRVTLEPLYEFVPEKHLVEIKGEQPMKEQIEKHELSDSIYMSGHGLDHKDSDDIAEQLYTEGYRKQSEWISVVERLPEREGKYLVYTYKGGIKFGEYRSYLVGEGKLCEPQFDYYVTHWMPLPEPPKTKGGRKE